MQRTIRRLLLIWLVLLGCLLLSQRIAPGLSYGLLVAVTCGSPVVAGLLLWLVVLRLRDAVRRIRVLSRAAKWHKHKLQHRMWQGMRE